MRRGCVDATGLDPGAAITFVAVPVLAVADQVKRALAETAGVVTDVGSVKGAIAAAIDDPRFVGGHPMAGSELDGLDGADGSMFNGAVWVLTPVAATDDVTFAHVAGVVAELGAEVVAMAPERHDDDGRRRQPRAAPHRGQPDGRGRRPGRGARRPAAPGRRRVPRHDPRRQRAAGHLARHLRREPPGHPLGARRADRPARGDARDRRTDDRDELFGRLQRAREARTNLPIRATQPSELAEVRIPIPDRTGAAAEIFTLAAELGVNIASFEVVHLAEGNVGVAVVLVAADVAELYRGGLIARGFRPAVTAPQLVALSNRARGVSISRLQRAEIAVWDDSRPMPVARRSSGDRTAAPRPRRPVRSTPW